MTAPLAALADTPSLYRQLVSHLPEGVFASEPLAWKALAGAIARADPPRVTDGWEPEHPADSVMMMVKVDRTRQSGRFDPMDKDTGKTRTIDLVVRKDRVGDTGSMILGFNPAIGRSSEEQVAAGRSSLRRCPGHSGWS